MQKIRTEAISLFFDYMYKGGQEALLTKDLICKKLGISIYQLNHILDNYYAELDKSNVFSQMWINTHSNSYTIPRKTSFVDSIVKSEHEKQIRHQLKENNDLERGVAV